jgi:hypothetical protein
MNAQEPAIRPLHELNGRDLASADPRYPKWATLCRHRLLGLPTLNAVLITPEKSRSSIAAAIKILAHSVGLSRLMLRSDGGTETRQYYRGGNTFEVDELPARISMLLSRGRAAILLEPTNRFTNQLTALLRMDRPTGGQAGQFTIEVLGPGYDVADLTRGGLTAQVLVTATGIDWSVYRELWWSDLRLSQNQSPIAEQTRKHQRLVELATHILADTGDLPNRLAPSDQASSAEAWLRERGFIELWKSQDIAATVARRARRWFDDAFMIGRSHPNRAWTCLATATSDLGSGRWVFWDVVDGSHKYGSIGCQAA